MLLRVIIVGRFFSTLRILRGRRFFTPFHWAKHAIGKPHLHGKCFDSSQLTRNTIFQRETNKIPVKQWLAKNGDIDYRIVPLLRAADEDGIGRLGSAPMAANSRKWDQMTKWFEGGAVASAVFSDDELYLRKSKGGNPRIQIEKTSVRTPGLGGVIRDGVFKLIVKGKGSRNCTT